MYQETCALIKIQRSISCCKHFLCLAYSIRFPYILHNVSTLKHLGTCVWILKVWNLWVKKNRKQQRRNQFHNSSYNLIPKKLSCIILLVNHLHNWDLKACSLTVNYIAYKCCYRVCKLFVVHVQFQETDVWVQESTSPIAHNHQRSFCEKVNHNCGTCKSQMKCVERPGSRLFWCFWCDLSGDSNIIH